VRSKVVSALGLSLVSLSFACYFAVVFAAYWLLRSGRAQKWLLTVASYLFYGFFDYRFCLLLLVASVLGLGLARRVEKASTASARKGLLATGLTLNVLVLGVFKYFDFFSEAGAEFLSRLGFGVDAPTLGLVLPIGLSFYLFKIMSYQIDAYRSKQPADGAALDFIVYVAFFPQLLSGPVDRASTFLPQLQGKRSLDYSLAVEGTRQVLWGLFKKLALADGVAVIVSSIMGDYQTAHGPELAFGAVLFSIQIYCDFSGYTDISIGVSKLLGFRPMRNFAYPYFSQNVAEFWRRWNISISSWFRDYVYIPLGGSRVRRSRLLGNIFVTFLLSGLWHGAGFTFLAWGGMLGLGVSFTAMRRRPVLRASDTPGGERLTLASFARMLATFAFISLSWVFFRSASLSEAAGIVTRILTPSFDPDAWLVPVTWLKQMGLLTVALGGFVVVEWLQRRREVALELSSRWRFARWAAYTATLWLTILLYNPGLSGAFLYYRF